MRVTRRDKAMDRLHRKVEDFKAIQTPSLLIIRKAPRGISASKGRLGIFPASFNPPTKAHLALIREAKRQHQLKEILVLLDLAPMDKRITGASIEDRLIMMKILFQWDPNVSIGLSNRGRFVDKLAPLRKLYPVPVGFLFIVGFDTILRVMDERYYRDRLRAIARLFQECQFWIAHRGDEREDSFEDFFRRKENRAYRNRVSFFVLPEEVSFLSSSLVRKTIRQGKSATELVPPKILRFIQDTGLYQTRDRRNPLRIISS
jgi:nicotinate (nicotinamide) nucleotide adenylyltransferase